MWCSRLHVAGTEKMLPIHEVPPEVRLCGKLEVLDRILPKLHATRHKASHHRLALATFKPYSTVLLTATVKRRMN